MKICFVSIDVEGESGETDFKGVENLDKILEIFRKHNIPATLFVIGIVLERYGEKFRQLAKEYEIASHAYTHRFWDGLNDNERKEGLEKFIELYQKIFGRKPSGFRAPSHIQDEKGLKLLEENGFLYDSSVVPHYPFFKKYRGFRGAAPLRPYCSSAGDIRGKGEMKILEIPVSGLLFGIPLAGAWISKLPIFIYRFLFSVYASEFLTLNLHSYDSLDAPLLRKTDKILEILKAQGYQFLTGEQIIKKFKMQNSKCKMTIQNSKL